MQFQFAYAVFSAVANAEARAVTTCNGEVTRVAAVKEASRAARDAGISGRQSGPGLGVMASNGRSARCREGAPDTVLGFKAFLKKIKNIQPDVGMGGAIVNQTGGLLAKQAPLGNITANLDGGRILGVKVTGLALDAPMPAPIVVPSISVALDWGANIAPWRAVSISIDAPRNRLRGYGFVLIADPKVLPHSTRVV